MLSPWQFGRRKRNAPCCRRWMGLWRNAAVAAVVVVGGCASEGPPTADRPIAILERSPERHYHPVWPVSARALAKEGKAALDEELRRQAREVGADAVIVERRYFDPSPAPGDEREIALGSPYPELLESFEPGAFPSATTGLRVYGPYVIAEGLAIRYPEGR